MAFKQIMDQASSIDEPANALSYLDLLFVAVARLRFGGLDCRNCRLSLQLV